MRFRPHCPGFVNDGETAERSQDFNSLEELREIPQVSRFLSGGKYELQKSFVKPHDDVPVTEHLLLAWRDDHAFYVIGYLSPADEVWDKLDLPSWKASR